MKKHIVLFVYGHHWIKAYIRTIESKVDRVSAAFFGCV
ncbi:hypothetical protein JOC76_004697 [Neobacillus cucumis]|nr:hypothetical protein [Neobacillus cucumis]